MIVHFRYDPNANEVDYQLATLLSVDTAVVTVREEEDRATIKNLYLLAAMVHQDTVNAEAVKRWPESL